MFERATIFSAILIFLVFSIIGYKYYQFMEAKNQSEPALSTSSSQ